MTSARAATRTASASASCMGGLRGRRAGVLIALVTTTVAARAPAPASVPAEPRVGEAGSADAIPWRSPPTERPGGFPVPALPAPGEPPRVEPRPPRAPPLGSVPVEIVVGEGTALATLERLATLPHTRVGVRTRGGNALHPGDAARLSRLDRVHLHLGLPLLPIHVDVLSDIDTALDVTVHVPEGARPERTLVERLARIGPGGRSVRLHGAPSPERVGAFERLRGRLTVTLPSGGLDARARDALGALETPRIEVRVRPGTDPAAVGALVELEVDAILLELGDTALPPDLGRAVSGTGIDTRARVDGGVSVDALRRLGSLPGLRIEAWIAAPTGIPDDLPDRLAAARGPGGGEGSPGGGAGGARPDGGDAAPRDAGNAEGEPRNAR